MRKVVLAGHVLFVYERRKLVFMKRRIVSALSLTLLLVSMFGVSSNVRIVKSNMVKNNKARGSFDSEFSGTLPTANTVDWWPIFHHDLTHTGYSTSPAPNTNQTLWKSPVYGFVDGSSPAVLDGVVYIGSYSYSGPHSLFALNATTGAQLWNYTVTSVAGAFTSPAASYGKVYVSSTDGTFRALNATTGELVWSDAIGAGNDLNAPSVVDGIVYVTGWTDMYHDYLFALNATTGATIWSVSSWPDFYNPWGSPAVADGKVFSTSETGIAAVNATTGALVWHYGYRSPYWAASPALANRIVYAAESPYVYALNATTGAQVWNYTTGGYIVSSPAVAYGTVYIGSDDRNVYALNATTGALVWSYYTVGQVRSSAAVADGKVYVGSVDYKVYALDALTGAFIWSYQTGYHVYSSPAVVDGKVYVGSNDGYLYAFGVHNVAVTKVKPTKTMTGQGCTISINVTVTNQGGYSETFNLTAYGNSTYIASQIVTLTAGNSATLTFTWNRPGFVNGTCTITAYAWPVPGETNTADNSLVITPGDVNADGVVDILDLSGLSAHWTGPPAGPLGYDLNFDSNCDGNINILDVAIVSAYWTGPPKGPLAP